MKQCFMLLTLIVALISCGGRGGVKSAVESSKRDSKVETSTTKAASTKAKEYGYRVVNVYPHSTGSYTQGLIWHNSSFIESTGQWGESRLMTVELETGGEKRGIALDSNRFGEGIALLNNRIYQLTWTSEEVYVYDLDTFEKLQTMRYGGEGWGLATDGKLLYMSNGSDQITVRDPQSFATIRSIKVRNGANRVKCLNELEWIEGELWANIYLTNQIVRIDPQTGKVTGIIDLTGLQTQTDRLPDTDVLNGIAYDPIEKRIFVTGKYWNKLYQIELVEK